MKAHLPEQLPLQTASEADYALVAHVIGVTPLALKLVMSNGVCVGTRKSGQIYLSPDALKVAKRWTDVQDSNDKSVNSPETCKTTEREEIETSNKALRKLRTNYVLIDLENVQPKNLDLLKGYDFRVMVFVGANQTKLPFDLATALQPFGEKVQYIKIDGNGQNALDFHISYYIGELCTKEPNSYFHIISKDTGFDPLIKHLKSRKIFVQRSRDLSEVPLLKISSTKSIEEKILAIVENLLSSGSSRPRKVTTLTNSVNSLFMKSLEASELTNIIRELEERKYIVVTQQGTVTYHLPSNSPNKANSADLKSAGQLRG